MRYSVIIPVYNRPDEVDELLQSLASQHYKDFEVVVVEDGSSIPCKEVVDRYTDRLDIQYFSKANSGPGQTRNYGAERSKGEYLIILDSDVILPEGYFDAIEKELLASPADAFGGPDRAHDSFTDIQKAIIYSMTSFFTTGGIRGGKKKMDKFYPRSFNMGVRREVYEALGGFSKMRFGEDIDFSIRIFKGGYTCRLFPDAWVYHKRRTDMLGTPFCLFSFTPIILYGLLVCLDSTIQNKSLHIGVCSISAAFIQLIGYGTGFWRAWWQRCVRGKDEFEAFRSNFYK